MMENEMHVVARHLRSAPVDLPAMLSDLGVELEERQIPSGASGWIERTGNRFRIAVDSGQSESRRRFATAHELAHYLLHRDLLDQRAPTCRHVDRLFDHAASGSDGNLTAQHEVAANHLAIQMLMPARLVRQQAAAGRSVAELAAAFQVPKTVMGLRLRTL